MKFVDIIILLPEIFLLNFILVFLWVGLYVRKSVSYVPRFSSYCIFIQVLTMLIIINMTFIDAEALLACFTTSANAVLTKLFTLILSIIIFSVANQTEITKSYSHWTVEVNTIKLFIIFSLLLLLSINNLVYMFFIFEVFSLSTYILVSHREKNAVYLAEVALKYFILGTMFSIVMAYSIAVIYWLTGLTNFSDLAIYFGGNLTTPSSAFPPIDLISVAVSLLLVSFLFKLVAAPFHQWAPDVYDGVSVSTMFFLFVAPKLAILSIILKLDFLWIFSYAQTLLIISIILSVVVGSFFGLFQRSVKRLLTYSMINNNAFFLISILAASVYNYAFLFFFLVIYSFTLIGLFTLLQTLTTRAYSTTFNNIWMWSNLYFTDKARALCLTLLLFSSAGIPPLVGFISKFSVLLTALGTGGNLHYLVLLILIFSTLTCFYYVRLVKVMAFSKRPSILFLKTPSFVSSYLISLSVVLLVVLFLISGLLLNFIFIQAI